MGPLLFTSTFFDSYLSVSPRYLCALLSRITLPVSISVTLSAYTLPVPD